jgi:hypothetical protein
VSQELLQHAVFVEAKHVSIQRGAWTWSPTIKTQARANQVVSFIMDNTI